MGRKVHTANPTLIIGDKGYIGTRLHDYIEADGIDLDDFRHWPSCEWNIEGYETIILLAGHSSMQLGRDDPDGAWKNNVVRFKELLDKLKDDQRLIYASSASVYNNIKSVPTEDCKEVDVMNMYDLSKWVIDQLATQSGKHTYGLRFCTVNGYSPILRVDLMLNKMVEDAREKGVVTIKNAHLTRPLLGINDLCRGVKAIVDSKEDKRGIYNFCSFNGVTVGEYAQRVAEKFGAVVINQGNEPHYVYGADTTKFEDAYNFVFQDSVDSILESLEQEPRERVIRVIN